MPDNLKQAIILRFAQVASAIPAQQRCLKDVSDSTVDSGRTHHMTIQIWVFEAAARRLIARNVPIMYITLK